MLSADLFGKLDDVGRMVRSERYFQPFGGLQLVICGDFFQLPPVPDLISCPACGQKLDRGYAMWAVVSLYNMRKG